VPDPYTQSIRLAWRPELRFYEQRVSILKSFEDEGVLRAFRVQENFVDARLFETRDLLTVRQDGLELWLATPDADGDRAWGAVEVALACVKPALARSMHVFFQHLAPLDMPFESAIKGAYGRLLGSLGTPGIRFDDWSLLADLEMTWTPPAAGQMEFGVVRGTEVIDRLTRQAGRTGVAQRPPDAWVHAQFPDVALFSDCQFSAAANPSQELGKQARNFWGGAREETGRLVGVLQKMIGDADDRGVTTHE